MLLAIDIGNTNISFGVFRGRRIVKRFSCPTAAYSRRKINRKILSRVTATIICSVVPHLTQRLAGDLYRLTGIRPYIIGKDVIVPIRNLYRRPAQVGQDRLVNAYAASFSYGAPLIVIDFGTAVTFDVVSKKREYLGGMIMPGLKISLDSLAQRTALLPSIRLTSPAEFIGRDTKNSMLSGIVYGFSSLVDGLCRKIKKRLGSNALVVATGGDAGLIGRYCSFIDRIDRDLTLKGLALIAEKVSKDQETFS